MTTLDKLNGWGNLKPGTVISPTPDVLFKRIKLSRFDQKQEDEQYGITTDETKETNTKPAPKPKNKAQAVNDISRFYLVVGKVLTCKNHPDADSLYVEDIDIGGPKPIQVVSGLAKFIPLDQMIGRLVVIVKNMKLTKIRGVNSEGMVIAAKNDPGTELELATPPAGARPGERIRFEGYGEDSVADQLNKNIIEKVKADLKTNGSCVATYKGVPFNTSAGHCTVATLKDAQLG